MGNGLPLFFILPCNNAGLFDVFDSEGTGKPNAGSCFSLFMSLGNNRTISALRLKHRSGSCGTASALPKCSIMSGCGTRIVLRGQKPLALCDRCPCFGSLFPPLAALTFAASSIICAFGLASAAPRSPHRHLELCGIALKKQNQNRLYPFPTPLAMGKRYGCSAAYCKNSGVFAQYLQPQFSKFHSSM